MDLLLKDARTLGVHPKAGTTGGSVLEHEPHDDRIPDLSGSSPPVFAEVPLAFEPVALVQGDSGGVVGPHLQGDLVVPVPLRPVDARLEESGAGALAPRAVCYQH